MNKYKMYFLHDPIGNTEQQLTNFDKEYIKQVLGHGFIIIGVTQNNVREIVKSIDDIVEPKIANMKGLNIVLPSYVDSKIDNLANIIEQLVDDLGSSGLKPSVFNNIKKSIQKVHDDSIKSMETDKKIIESSSNIIKKEDV